MYVKIKKPKNWVTSYKWKFFTYIENIIGEEKTDKITDITQSVVNWTWNYPRRAHKDNKPTIRIDYWDTWSMDATLSPIIEPMLKQLKATGHGAPFTKDEDVPDELKSISSISLTEKEIKQGYPDNNHDKRWDWVLNEIIWAFEQKNSDWEDQFYSGVIDRISILQNPEDPEENHRYRMEHGPNHTYKVDWDAYRAHQKRMSNGFRLFGVYFENLWD